MGAGDGRTLARPAMVAHRGTDVAGDLRQRGCAVRGQLRSGRREGRADLPHLAAVAPGYLGVLFVILGLPLIAMERVELRFASIGHFDLILIGLCFYAMAHAKPGKQLNPATRRAARPRSDPARPRPTASRTHPAARSGDCGEVAQRLERGLPCAAADRHHTTCVGKQFQGPDGRCVPAVGCRIADHVAAVTRVLKARHLHVKPAFAQAVCGLSHPIGRSSASKGSRRAGSRSPTGRPPR